MTDIFFSYSSKDRDLVEPAHKALTGRGFDVFWDLQVPAGIDWDRWIHARLEQSRCVIVFWTANSAASRNVRHETAIAAEDGKLLQVLLEPLSTRDLPMGMLAEQAVRLVDWRGDSADPEWAKLIAAVEERAAPAWLKQKTAALEIALKAERQRVASTDAKLRALEEAYSQEIAAQAQFRHEHGKLKEELERLAAQVSGAGGTDGGSASKLCALEISLAAWRDEAREAGAKLQALEERCAREAAAQDELRRECARLKEERERLEAGWQAIVQANEKVHEMDTIALNELRAERGRLKAECESLAEKAAAAGAGAKAAKPGGPKSDWDTLFAGLALVFSVFAYLPQLALAALSNRGLVADPGGFAGSLQAPAVLACLLCVLTLISYQELSGRGAALLGSALVFLLPIGVGFAALHLAPAGGWWHLAYLLAPLSQLAAIAAGLRGAAQGRQVG